VARGGGLDGLELSENDRQRTAAFDGSQDVELHTATLGHRRVGGLVERLWHVQSLRQWNAFRNRLVCGRGQVFAAHALVALALHRRRPPVEPCALEQEVDQATQVDAMACHIHIAGQVDARA
jgi:hypothetical protein